MSDAPDAFLSHMISGRARLKVPSKKGDSVYFKSLQEQFSGYSGIQAIKVNPLTGSILIFHSEDIKKIAIYAQDMNIFKLKNKKYNPTKLRNTISKVFKDMNKKIVNITGGDMDTADIVFLALLGLGIYQISRGNFVAPAWYTAFWYGLNIFLKAKPDEEVEGE